MIVTKIDKWHLNQNCLSRYFIERLLQLTDYKELISNRHKTTNGYIILAEINEVTRLVIARQKSIHRFKSIIKESVDKKLTSSLFNDPVLNKYHKDIIDFYMSLNISEIEKHESKIKELQTRTRIFLKRLDIEYYDQLKQELKSIDFEDSSKIRRNQKSIDIYLETLIPFLIFKGYSVESLSKVALKMTGENPQTSMRLFFSVFNLRDAEIEIILNSSSDELTNQHLKEYLDSQEISYSIVKRTSVDQLPQNEGLFDEVMKIKTKTIDANTYIRDLYDNFIKNFIISKERTSLSYFLNFFETTYWKILNHKNESYKQSGFNHDPINVIKRESTLRSTLTNVSEYYGFEFDSNSSLPKIDCIAEAIYFYNLALGSKSIENSLNLLWTSLETLIPYGKHQSDIANIQYFFPKFLSAGAYGRQLLSFVTRFTTSNFNNSFMLNSIKVKADFNKPYDVINITRWLKFLIQDFKDSDPFDDFKKCSELLCKQFCDLSEKWGVSKNSNDNLVYGKVQSWLDRVDGSKRAIQYQLDRIYLHRNQIIHTGKFINEYSNLWAHLEWYLGKILSYCYIKHYQDYEITSKKNLLIELEGESEMIYQFLLREKNRNISELTDEELKKLFMQLWLFM